MSEVYFLYALIGVFLLQAAERATVVVLANWCDFRHMKSKRLSPKEAGRKPLVTVIVLTHNDARTIRACLESIQASRYPKIEIICIDNKSEDGTADQVKRCQGSFLVQAIRKRKIASRKEAYHQALRKARGSVVMLLDGKTTIFPYTIERALTQLQDSSNHSIIMLSRTVLPYPSIFTLFQRFIHIIDHQCQKARAVLGRRNVDLYASGMVYEKAHLTKLKRTPAILDERNFRTSSRHQGVRLEYDASNPVAYAAATTASQLTAALSAQKYHDAWTGVLPKMLTVLNPVMIMYFFYLAYTFKNGALFLLTWLSLVLWLSLAVISNENLKLIEKVSLVVAIPAMYVLFFVESIVRVIEVIVAAIKNLKPSGRWFIGLLTSLRNTSFAKR